MYWIRKKSVAHVPNQHALSNKHPLLKFQKKISTLGAIKLLQHFNFQVCVQCHKCNIAYPITDNCFALLPTLLNLCRQSNKFFFHMDIKRPELSVHIIKVFVL